MYLPLWFILGAVALLAANFAIALVGLWRNRRHHDHLIPTTPRSYRASA